VVRRAAVASTRHAQAPALRATARYQAEQVFSIERVREPE